MTAAEARAERAKKHGMEGEGVTREEIIEGLRGIHAVTANYKGDQVILHNMPMKKLTGILYGAAELLKAQEPDEDWISRKRLRDEIRYYIEEAGWGDEANKVLGWCLEFIDNQEKVKWE